jgi:DNA-binding CsgD family transcriptional regulator
MRCGSSRTAPRGLGYLLKDRIDDIGTLRDALVRLAAGESVIDPEIVSRLLTRHQRASDLDELSDRERAVLRHMAEGRSNAGIGEQLFLSPKTVETHVANVFAKLGLPAAGDANRRVLAVLTWLHATTTGEVPRWQPQLPGAMVTSRTVWTSVASPVAAVKPTRTSEGRSTAVSRTWLPSRLTRSRPAA